MREPGEPFDGPTFLEFAMKLAAIILVCLLYFSAVHYFATKDDKPFGVVAGSVSHP